MALTGNRLPATHRVMTRLRIALEWFLKPDHLPLLAAQEQLRSNGWDIDLIIADDHYDGFQALAEGAADMVANEPLTPVHRSAAMWRPKWRYLQSRGGDVVDKATFEAMFA